MGQLTGRVSIVFLITNTNTATGLLLSGNRLAYAQLQLQLISTKERNFENEFSAHPSIRATAEENRRKNAIHNSHFKYTNKTQVEKLLPNINARKACDHDTITPRLLKESASAISGPLAELINESIKQWKYPSRWKMGQITPLFKKNDELSKENYRPVTVLPGLNNVFEKLLASQLDQFYSEILSDYISAYRRHYSCETSLIRDCVTIVRMCELRL